MNVGVGVFHRLSVDVIDYTLLYAEKMVEPIRMSASQIANNNPFPTTVNVKEMACALLPEIVLHPPQNASQSVMVVNA